MLGKNIVPKITDPLGEFWEQPQREDIGINTTHAVMSNEAFNKLKTYSTTNPTGVYPGKMWKGEVLAGDKKGKWMLRWYGIEDPKKPGYVFNFQREIILSDPENTPKGKRR